MKGFFVIILCIGIILGYVISQENQNNNTTIQNNKIIMPLVAANNEIGMIGNITIEIIPGNGRILFDNNPAIDTDMQYAMIISKTYAEYYTGKSLKNNDVLIDIDIPLETIGGDSSGATITVGLIALLEQKKINKDIILTGAISPDGIIRRVGEVREKATIAQDTGYKLILVPQGQLRYRFQNYTLQEYLNNTIEIREIRSIEDAVKIMINST
ncbi:MAG: S16 family serine protease [Candidatus Woesearchaeota archaeon]